jgi:hypothetical protein
MGWAKKMGAIVLVALAFGLGVATRPSLQTLVEQFTPQRELRCLEGTEICLGAQVAALGPPPPGTGYVLVAVYCGSDASDLIFFPAVLARDCARPPVAFALRRGGRDITVNLNEGRIERILDQSSVTLP